MKTEILAYVKEHPGTSFVELQRVVPGFSGEKTLWSGEREDNILLWDSISQEGIEALQELMQSNDIEVRSSHFLVYMVDGILLNLPIARRRVHYKKPHWLPATMSVPRKSQKERCKWN
jgi:hypothetical protein